MTFFNRKERKVLRKVRKEKEIGVKRYGFCLKLIA
jgi:hypothetical protein